MDIRIVNTCNNNCLYCLEKSLRNREKYISKSFLFNEILLNIKDNNITFFGGNPLLHPNILEIIIFCRKNGFKSIGILSNTYGINKENILDLKRNGLTSFGIYFNSFNKKNHELVNGGGISYDIYLQNLDLLSKSGLNIKIIIHINKLNIDTIARDIIILKEKYGVINFDFVNYFPFDFPYFNKKLLEYYINEKRVFIDTLFKIIKKLKLRVKFVKFSKDFFGNFLEFYSFKKGIIEQIGEEDLEVLNSLNEPFCKIEKRCINCFLKDKCKWYEL